MIPLLKAGGALATIAAAFVWAQVEGFPLDDLGNIVGVAALAVIVARYTLRQLEDYRTDLKTSRSRIDDLEADLHALGQAKGEVERRLRDTEDYAHRLRIYILSTGANRDDLPAPPGSSV